MPFGISFFIPPLRHFVTPLLKERLFVWLPLRGAVNAVDCGGACSYFHMTVIFYRIVFHPSVTSWHLSSRRGFCRAPIEGSQQRSDCGVDFYNFHTSLLIFLTYHKYIVHMGLCPRRPFLSNLFLSVGTITLVAPFMFSHFYGQWPPLRLFLLIHKKRDYRG